MKLTYKIMIPIVFALSFLLGIILIFTQQSLKDALIKEEFLKIKEITNKRIALFLSVEDFRDPFHPISQKQFQNFTNDTITPSIDRLTIWSKDRTIVFSTMKALTGYTYPDHQDLEKLFVQGKSFFALRTEDINEPVYYSADEFLDAYIPVRISGEFLGAVEVHVVMAATLSSLSKQFNNLTMILILSGILILFAVWGVVHFFILKPIRRLEKAANHIRNGNFNYQFSSWASDEIGGLTNNFNIMRLALKKNSIALKKEQNLTQRANKKLSGTVDDLNYTQIALRSAVSDLKEAKQQVEKTVKERTEELRYEKEKLDHIAQNMDLGALLLDKNQKVLFINKVAQKILKTSMTHNENALEIFIKKFPKFNIQSYINQCVKGGKFEIQEAESDGEIFYIAFQGSSVTGHGKNHFCHFIWIRNITQEKLLERSKSEFVAIASHQLRTPLTVTKGNVEMMLDETFGKLNKEQKDILAQTSSANERLINMVNDMLDVTKIEKDGLNVALEKIDLVKVLASIQADLKDYAAQHKVVLKYKKPSKKIPLVMGNVLRMQQVLQNLIDNAIRYSVHRDDVDSFVEIIFRVNGDMIETIISDNGLGIPQQEQSEIFQRFYRATNATKFSSSGTGLGLYIVKAIIEQFGGTISFISQEGKGTVFTFTLPITKS